MRNCMELGVCQGRKDCGICHPTQRSLELPPAAPQAHPVSHMDDADLNGAAFDGFDLDPTPTSLEQVGYWVAVLATSVLSVVVLCGTAGYLYIRMGG